MKIEVAPERDGRVVITIIPEEDGKPEVALKEGLEAKKPEAKAPEVEEVKELQPEANFRRATEKQIRYFHILARKAGIADTHAWMEENGFPPSSKDCSQAQLSKAIDMLKDLEWARSLEAPGWRKQKAPEPAEAA